MFTSNVNTTYRLGNNPSFISGYAMALDIRAVSLKFNESKTAEEADEKALKSDWEVVGLDIQQAMKQYEQEQK